MLNALKSAEALDGIPSLFPLNMPGKWAEWARQTVSELCPDAYLTALTSFAFLYVQTTKPSTLDLFLSFSPLVNMS